MLIKYIIYFVFLIIIWGEIWSNLPEESQLNAITQFHQPILLQLPISRAQPNVT